MIEATIPLFKVFMPDNTSKKVEEVLQSGFLAEGEKVKSFAAKISQFIGNPYVVMTNSCTTALSIAYRLAGVGPNTEVITTALTCVAGNEPIAMLGAKAVWADVDRETGMITADTILPLITSKTKAIYILHKEGSPADIENIYTLAKRYNIKVIEDAAHAFGAKRNNVRIGARGDYVCFSFQAIKHITTGDGGALLLGNEEDFLAAKKMKWFGVDRDKREGRDVWREDIIEWGFKGNMNDISASIGLSQMEYVDYILQKFHENGRRYDDVFSQMDKVKTLKRNFNDFQTYWGYTILIEDREKISDILSKNGIGHGQIHVRNDIYSMFKNNKTNLPNTDWFDMREISIPCGWWVNKEKQDYIIKTIKDNL